MDKIWVRAQQLGQDRVPSAAARKSQGAGRCGDMSNYFHDMHVLNWKEEGVQETYN